MDQLERFLLIASSEDVTHAIDFSALDAVAGPARTQYLGMALQKVLQGAIMIPMGCRGYYGYCGILQGPRGTALWAGEAGVAGRGQILGGAWWGVKERCRRQS
jgi:hypothetical protein